MRKKAHAFIMARRPQLFAVLIQARDRDFDSVFLRSHEATRTIKDIAKTATCCQASFADLADTVIHVDHMLRHMEVMFPGDTNRTIVSLKHLCVQLESSASVCAIYNHLPKLTIAENLCGGKGRLKALAREGDAEIGRQTKAVTTYATALLLEHGFRASELREFRDRELPTPGQGSQFSVSDPLPPRPSQGGRNSFGNPKGGVKFSCEAMDRLAENSAAEHTSEHSSKHADGECVSTHSRCNMAVGSCNSETPSDNSFSKRERKSSIDQMFKHENSMGIIA